VRSQAVAVERVLQRLQPDFHLLAGDISYADASGAGLATDTYVPERWFSYFQQVDPVARSIPWMVSLGNHDMEALYPPHGYGGFSHRFSMPANGPAGCPGVYSFVYGPLAVISLDANDVTDEFVANRGYSGNGQLTWARERLRTLRSDPTIDFIAAVFHQCAYSTGHHGSDLGVRTAFAPLFDEFGVDLAISGHNHVYERTDPLRAGRATRPVPSGSSVNAAQDGTTYVICGAGGADLTPFEGKPDRNDLATYRGPDVVPALLQGGAPEHVGWSRARYTGHCLVLVDVSPAVSGTPSAMTLRAMNIRGSTFDTVTFTGPRRPTSFFAENQTTLLAGTAGAAAVAAGSAIALRRRHDASRGDPTAGAAAARDDQGAVRD
jgi:hypothetical protein